MVTITVSSWGSGQYKITRDSCELSKRPTTKHVSKVDPAHAAAEVMNLARGLSEYAIFAPSDVLAFIPERLRCK